MMVLPESAYVEMVISCRG
ncbi:hypothetical protein [Nostoc sp.]